MKTILVPLDFSDVTDSVVATLPQFAKAFKGKVYLIHVAPPDPDFVGYEAGPQTVRDAIAAKYHDEHKKLQAYEHNLQSLGIDVTALLLQGPTVEKILEEADRLSAEVIIMGSHGHGALYDLIVGSVTEGVLRRAKRPVLVLPSKVD